MAKNMTKKATSTSSGKVILTVEEISFNYPSQNSFKGIRDLSFSVAEGEFVSILGKSGSGKTTLLKCIYGLEELESGSIHFLGEKVLGPSYHLIPGQKGMSLVSQDFYVLENHTLAENISEKLSGYTPEYKHKRTRELLTILQLKPFEYKKARELSSGQRQRLSIARALAEFPKLILLDEPFSNLDAGMKDDLLTYIRKEAKKKKSSVIMVTHQAEETLKFSDQIIVLKDGKIAQQGTPEQVYYFPKNMEIARLFGKAFRVKAFNSDLKILRPEYFELSNEDDSQLKVEVKNDLFCGGCFEVSGEDENKNVISFYSENPIADERKNVFLKLREKITKIKK